MKKTYLIMAKAKYGRYGKVPKYARPAKSWFNSKWGRRLSNFPIRLATGSAGGAVGFIGGGLSGAYSGFKYGYNNVPRKYLNVKMKRKMFVGSNQPQHQFASNPRPVYGSNPPKHRFSSNPPLVSRPVQTPGGVVMVPGRKSFIRPIRGGYKRAVRKKFY